MKNLFALIVAAALLTAYLDAGAQSQKVSRGQSPGIVAKGNFSNGLTTTVLRTYASSALPLYTKKDTVNGSSGVDTFKLNLVGDYNCVAIQQNITKIGGRIDSFTLTWWGSLDGVNYVSLNTATATNTAGTKAYTYLINSGAGNPYAYYMVTAACTNAASGSSASWTGFTWIR